MIKKQYTRIYLDPVTEEVTHVHTQDTPIPPDLEPVVGITAEGTKLEPVEWEDQTAATKFCKKDFVFELDGSSHVDARSMLEELKFQNGHCLIKEWKPAGKRKFSLLSVTCCRTGRKLEHYKGS